MIHRDGQARSELIEILPVLFISGMAPTPILTYISIRFRSSTVPRTFSRLASDLL